MKTNPYIILTLILLSLTSCMEEIKNCEQTTNRNILVLNKTPHKKTTARTAKIDDQVFLNNMCTVLFKYRKRLSDVKIRNSQGFLEVIFEENKDYYFLMIYTENDGTVFRMSTNTYYQNDSLVNLLESKVMLPD
ncbi:hypothetical protein FGM00_08925 [Aggregatimonas sangjinii]|uniref:Uncharacterized protein n=1 Tax=Aggregatimonas sangjinii TaxID=2583587 RepID=A0A5B7SNT1_9FLAO|nr:hypothetical protein [Aggregatimonas sangjinii]QCX00226.1 hypothetical protein FGM00_08925 [Aggregatimonas sangjinii]